MKFSAREEILLQRNVLSEVSHDNPEVVMNIINYNHQIIPATFRKIIEIFEETKNRIPTEIELILETEQCLNINLYKIA